MNDTGYIIIVESSNLNIYDAGFSFKKDVSCFFYPSAKNEDYIFKSLLKSLQMCLFLSNKMFLIRYHLIMSSNAEDIVNMSNNLISAKHIHIYFIQFSYLCLTCLRIENFVTLFWVITTILRYYF